MRRTTFRRLSADPRWPDARYERVPALRRALRKRRAANKVAAQSRRGNR